MDGLCLKAGIQGIKPPINVIGCGVSDFRTNSSNVAATVGQLSVSGNALSVEKPPQRSSSWGFSFRYPLKSLWPGGRSRQDAIAVDDAVLVENKEEKMDGAEVGKHAEDGSWVQKILHMRSLWNAEDAKAAIRTLGEEDEEEEKLMSSKDERDSAFSNCEEECIVCSNDDDYEEKIEFDRHSFSKLLKKVSLADARSYAKMSYLGNLVYSIPQIKPENLFKHHGLRFVTSSLEKKEQALKAEQEKESDEVLDVDESPKELIEEEEKKSTWSDINKSTVCHTSASADLCLHCHPKRIDGFKSVKSQPNEGHKRSIDNVTMVNEDVASLLATTNSITAVVAAEEDVKQAVADEFKSTCSSPCEWFICDDDENATRFFVIQGSESLASWQANLLFEPIQFEGLDELVHRGIYEAAKGMYNQMLPEIRAHVRAHGDRASFRFTGHSLGGSLSLLVNLMLLIRGEVPSSSLLPVITFGSPSIMCGGDHLLHKLGLPRSHVRAITMHRDIVPRAFSCQYPNHVAQFLKAVNKNFRSHPCLNNKNILYEPMGELLILQPDEKFSPNHHLLPSGSGLYVLSHSTLNPKDEEKYIHAAQRVFLNSPHPLEILGDRSAYGSGGSIQRDHDMRSYWKSVRSVIRQELNRMRKTRREHRRKVWWPLVTLDNINSGIIIRGAVSSPNLSHSHLNFSGFLHTGKESLKRFSRLVASQHMHLLVVLLFPARLLIFGTQGIINFR